VPPPPAPAPVVRQHVPIGRVGDVRDGSPVVLGKLGARTVAFVADEDDEAVRTVDLATHAELARTQLTGRPSQALLTRDGRLLVALRDDQAVQILEATDDASLDASARIETEVEPVGLALTPDDATLLVTTGWGHALEAFDIATRARSYAVDLAREPRAVTVSSDGATAFVSHAASGHVSAIDLAKHEVRKVDLAMSGWTEKRRGGRFSIMLDFKVEDPRGELDCGFQCGFSRMNRVHTVTFPSRVARQGFALAKVSTNDGKSERVLAPHVAVATGDARVVSTGYGGGGIDQSLNVPTEMFDIDVIDAAKVSRATGTFSRAAMANRSGAGACRLPRAAVVDADRHALYLACLGTNEVVEYDAADATPTSQMKRRFHVAAGPTGLALDTEKRAIVWSQFDRVVSIVPLADVPKGERAPEPITIALSAPGSGFAPEAALGRKLFHSAADARIAKDGRACASCHPDGRDDGLVWSTPNGPRQTILLAGRVSRAAPFGWMGKHTSLSEHVTSTMKNLSGTGLAETDRTALVGYLAAMRPPPRAKNAVLGEEEQRGRDLFHASQTGCATCHAEETGFSDRDVHDVGSATGADTTRQFLAPSLRFIAGSAPYFHDGRYATLDELLLKNDKMGNSRTLSEEDRAALAAYLRTL
jgi:DNA-binding beta-propeller fold protein YncE